MALCDRDLVTRLLKQSILTLCREAVTYTSRLDVDGIICLTVDEQDQHVVKIHEVFERNPAELLVRTGSNERQPSSSRTSPFDTDTLKEKDSLIATAIKSEPEEATNADEDMKLGRTDSHQETQPGHIGTAYTTGVDYTSMGLDKLIRSSEKNIHCSKCNILLENVELFQVHNLNSHGLFTCLVCLATFTSRNNMKRHIRLHTGIKPYSCHKCPESFSRNDDFKRHLLKHTFRKPFRCAVCNTGYSDRSCVKSHMLKDHKSKVYHICPQCGESYTDLQDFQQHKKCHPDFQDYRCSLCSFTGSNALMYNKHMLTHGPLKEYRCDHCDLSYTDPFIYTGHLKKHKGNEMVQSYVCCFCDMSLSSFEQFQRHEHTHVHSKQHVCKVCNKIFRYPSNLREHMLTHLSKSSFSPAFTQYSTMHDDGVQMIVENDDSSATNLFASIHNEKMETEEESNNLIGSENVSDKEDTGGASGYWCTECNHGFGTESKLKNHIADKHENKTLEFRASNTRTDQEESDNEEINKQLDFVNDDAYNIKTNSVSNESSSYDKDHHSLFKKYMINGPLKCQNKARKIDQNLDEKPLVNETDCPTYLSLKASLRDKSARPNVVTEVELNTVKHAMKEVENIQHRYGIKASVLDPLTRSDERIPEIDMGVERTNSFLSPSSSELNTKVPADRSMSVLVSGMKIKIQRTPHTQSKTSNEAGTYVQSVEKYAKDNETVPDEKYTEGESPISGINGDTSDFSSRRSATTINLQVRNPGFERVVTPEILFKTKAPFTCGVCEETFGSFDDFHEHGVKVHRRFICSYCGKVFTSRPNRERHIRYHTGEKPYKCDLCSATFLRGDDLKYHRTTKHADIKPFTCGACQTSFALPKDLEKHLKIYPDHRI